MTLASTECALQPGSKILVTGANSYIGSHIVDVLLSLKYKVRGTVRTERPWLNTYFDTKYGPGNFETVVVPRMQDEGAFDGCLGDVEGVVHVAADLSLSGKPELVIPVTVNGCLNMLKAASKTKTVRRFVLTSSSAAATTPRLNEKYIVDENTWNKEAIELAWDKNTPSEQMSWWVYAASKAESEMRAWEFMDREKPNFSFSSVVTGFNVGEILMPETKGSVSMGGLRTFLAGNKNMLNLKPQWFVDIGDTGRLHVAALLDPEIRSRRLFAFARPYNCTLVIELLRRMRPNNKLIPDPLENEGSNLSEVPPRLEAEKLIDRSFGQKHWTDVEKSIEAGIRDLE